MLQSLDIEVLILSAPPINSAIRNLQGEAARAAQFLSKHNPSTFFLVLFETVSSLIRIEKVAIALEQLDELVLPQLLPHFYWIGIQKHTHFLAVAVDIEEKMDLAVCSSQFLTEPLEVKYFGVLFGTRMLIATIEIEAV